MENRTAQDNDRDVSVDQQIIKAKPDVEEKDGYLKREQSSATLSRPPVIKN